MSRGANGFDSVELLFSPNPGEPLKPLRAIASSGEISRLMLAIKSALAAHDEIPLLVFDEIDTNVGGEIAHAVGAKMQTLGAQSSSDLHHPSSSRRRSGHLPLCRHKRSRARPHIFEFAGSYGESAPRRNRAHARGKKRIGFATRGKFVER